MVPNIFDGTVNI